MNIVTSIILGVVQGLTEFLPISSSGHLLLVRDLLHLDITNTLSFDIFLNTATLLVVIYYFWGEVRRLVIDFFTEGFSSRSIHLLYALVVGTIPAAIIGFKYGARIESAFRSSSSVALALVVGSLIMWIAEIAYKKYGGKGGLSIAKAFIVGSFQSFALVPGISRSGASISGGLLSKLSREEAIRFSFLLYIPVSLGAALKAVLDVHKSASGFSDFINLPHILAFLAAIVSGLWAIRFLVTYLKNNSFAPFIIYRLLLAAVILIFL